MPKKQENEVKEYNYNIVINSVPDINKIIEKMKEDQVEEMGPDQPDVTIGMKEYLNDEEVSQLAYEAVIEYVLGEVVAGLDIELEEVE